MTWKNVLCYVASMVVVHLVIPPLNYVLSTLAQSQKSPQRRALLLATASSISCSGEAAKRQNQPSEVFYKKKDFLENFAKFTGNSQETCARASFSIKL